jgi:uncharacterized protein
LRAFVGQTAFEQISREWVISQGKAGRLPFEPEVMGSHWSATVQADVVAINWHEKKILIGECKWGADGIDRQIARELIAQKTPKVLAYLPDGGNDWQVHHAIFARSGFTDAAQSEMKKVNGLMVVLEQLDADMSSLTGRVSGANHAI